MVTNDDALMERLISFRVHGGATPTDAATMKFEHETKYLNVRIGMNSRLDTIQAAVLVEKLAIFGEEIALRQAVADRYAEKLGGKVLSVPLVKAGYISTWAQYTIEYANRDGLQAHLRTCGCAVGGLLSDPAASSSRAIICIRSGGLDLAVSEAKAKTVISACRSAPYLTPEVQDEIIAAVLSV